jgi:hypothetical protein
MSFDLVQIRKLAQEKEDENWQLREFPKTQCHQEPEFVIWKFVIGNLRNAKGPMDAEGGRG